MKFRTRLVLTISIAMAITVTAGFSAAVYVVEHSEERQLDDALRAEAHEEASQIAANATDGLHVSDRAGAETDVGHLTKYAVIYEDDGRAIDRTISFSRGVPSFKDVVHPRGVPFDIRYRREKLRAIFVAIPGHPNETLLFAAPRSDLEKDTTFLREVMLASALVSILVTILVVWRVVRNLTRGHEAIGETARKVTAGDLAARVTVDTGDDEVVQLANDVNEMVQRLAVLVEGQQRFVANAAHELRSPLTSLYGELQLALRRSRSAAEYRTAIEEALDSTRRLKALAEDLLALARLGADREVSLAPVSLDEVARSAAAWVERETARRHVNLEVDTDGSNVLGHAMDLERMLKNLLDNAVRHTPEGGYVHVRAKSEGDTVHVTVADSGPGVPADDRERVFEPFFRADAERRRDVGSGLGLAIVREIARGHGGDVTLEDGPGGRGALFRARLPAAPSNEECLPKG
ncbi:MAG: HAMP domain-containing histidine kinase [Polyangiaceae bacterium]|nr:HAMP domain-containing histidine kinase [Polyangiaceae bacterium]